MQKSRVFYAKGCKTLVVIPDYYISGTGSVDELEANISLFKNQIIQEFAVNSSDIKIQYVAKSTRYKRMYVFFVNNVDENNLPDYVWISELNRWDIVE